MNISACPCCHGKNGQVFYQVGSTPANSCLLIPSRQEALEFPCGILDLACCPSCGFVWNASFDSGLIEYSERYEETQGYSPTFGRFHRQLALDLIERYDLRHKQILEIGCGKGEFLALLCELGGNQGIGFDPAFRPGRVDMPADGTLQFIADLYSEKYASVPADFICCKMTLEHISNPRDFVHMLRQAIGERNETVVFILVPDAGKIIAEGAFEDFYYEHCSYFCSVSLCQLFAEAGFSVSAVKSVYDGQYLALSALPDPLPGTVQKTETDQLTLHLAAVKNLADHCFDQRERWKARLMDWRQSHEKVVLWGSGSKAVGFLTAVEVPGAIAAVVDINPHKSGTFMPASGLPIVSPASLRDDPPKHVIVMNPIYCREIALQLQGYGLNPQIFTLRNGQWNWEE
ncbi:class I SAM-dependent methyltransferase [Desulfuromonas sp. AOP6]|uniref:class I SAM-dependent methyltransferase n=1 Tax=Desulfuromonas sp. AOP6 TaxID=1566351 RepID=UPI0012764D6D|nr:class I SAM-dependent methyltransferase [Desulfuromonas sp. AOP6]BCA79491.1 NDP-hexose methyltransferase [Desulfuromonas sp. AOP6]